MSGPMYFNPSPAQVAIAKASTCEMATPKDPTDCEHAKCCHKNAANHYGKQCPRYRPRQPPVSSALGQQPSTT